MFVIGITGGTGSGKTTVINTLIENTKNIDISFLSSDSYYKDNSNLSFGERDKLNYDEPNAMDFDLLTTHLKDLKKGKSINVPDYCFNNHLRLKNTNVTNPCKILVLEGILILNNEKLRNEIDYSIFLDCPREIRLNRRVSRDVKERGRKKADIIDLFKNVLDETHKIYIDPLKKYCNLVLDTSKKANISEIINIIKELVVEKNII
tara:strand:- start:502 stop:1119 length:618 start_codon:yes stop_codon:yes gene_type:complete